MRIVLLSVAGVCAALVLGIDGFSSGANDAVLDRASASYLEDAVVRRPVAAIEVVLRRIDGQRLVDVTLLAQGPGVEPLPGLQGVPGTNLRTAEELHRLLDENALRLVTREDGVDVVGTLVAVEHDSLPMRVLTDDGSLDVDARTAAQWPVRVVFRSAPLPDVDAALEPGAVSRVYVVARDLPRLLVEVRGEHVTSIESLAEHPTEVQR